MLEGSRSETGDHRSTSRPEMSGLSQNSVSPMPCPFFIPMIHSVPYMEIAMKRGKTGLPASTAVPRNWLSCESFFYGLAARREETPGGPLWFLFWDYIIIAVIIPIIVAIIPIIVVILYIYNGYMMGYMIILVGGIPTPLKNMSQLVWWNSQYMEK